MMVKDQRLRYLAKIHGKIVVTLMLMLVSASQQCSYLPDPLQKACVCSQTSGGLKLTCKGVRELSVFQDSGSNSESVESNSISNFEDVSEQWEKEKASVVEIEIKEGGFKCANLHSFNGFRSLSRLSITGSKLSRLGRCSNHENSVVHPSETDLSFNLIWFNVAENSIRQVIASDLPPFKMLQHFNLSGNSISHIEPIFAKMTNLQSLDLSSNKLDENMDPAVFKTLPLQSLSSVDISSELFTLIQRFKITSKKGELNLHTYHFNTF